MRLPFLKNKSRRTVPLFSPFVMGLIRPMNVSCVYSVCAVSASPPKSAQCAQLYARRSTAQNVL